ncbi:MAG: hypothetical protein ACRDIB_12065 [Ardenticatenaceae bacterium]
MNNSTDFGERLRAIIEAQEDARLALARQMHDGPAQARLSCGAGHLL